MSAKELTALIQDEERLRGERQDRRSWKSRVTGLDDSGPPPEQFRPHGNRRERRGEEDDDEMRRAIEASKSEAEAEELKRRRAAAGNEDEDAALAKALKLSKEEEELRRRELEEANTNLLFDDTPSQQPAISQPTGYNGGYQQQPSVDWFGNVIDPNQPQQTGFGMQGQPTGYQNGFNNNPTFGYQQPQQTGFGAASPFGQPQNSFLQSQQNIQPQQTAYQSNNPYVQQPNGFGQQDQSQLQPQDSLQAGSNNPWGNNGQSLDALKPLPTGSNNPFGNTFTRPQSTNTNRLQPTLNSLSEQNAASSFNPITNYQAPPQPQPSIQRPISQPTQPQFSSIPEDPHKARLNALLSSGEGQDTFGNVGDLRIPAQHTAPGVFVNSAGANAQRLTGQATGNPFLQSQFTGMPNATYGQGQQMPAQTGPVAGFGASGYGQQQQNTNNPFGGAQQRPNQQGGGGSLIDL
jgi:epsin